MSSSSSYSYSTTFEEQLRDSICSFESPLKTKIKVDSVSSVDYEGTLFKEFYDVHQSHLEEVGENEQVLYHGTSAERAQNIATKGFMMSYATSGYFGQGLYFSPDPYMALSYCPKKDSPKVLIVARVLMGRSYEGREKLKLNEPPEGYHSICGPHPKKSAQVACIYRDSQAYPVALVSIKPKKGKKKGGKGHTCKVCPNCKVCHGCQ